ncbi:hypothetical protein AB395_0000526 [Sinorhizobium fredii CCBAU 45436]|nr:hypothetical protein SF83666_c05010 [Sinorhizobium fredii CCBAU 83666]AWI56206.1 hypothetical protein AB395_0000526 [Sinorhizobium fredii CCBAU 45436]AWM23874.1 hypothetical protein AOX55_0000595 [Sinorhizobium fredii CCBAU 25509]
MPSHSLPPAKNNPHWQTVTGNNLGMLTGSPNHASARRGARPIATVFSAARR